MEKIILNIYDMHCASCALNIESALKKSPAVIRVGVNFANQRAYIEYDPKKADAQALIGLIKANGYRARQIEDYSAAELQLNKSTRDMRLKAFVSLGLSILLMYVSMAHAFGIYVPEIVLKNSVILQLIVSSLVLACGYQFFIRGFSGLLNLGRANMDTLVALGVGSAYLYSLVISIAIFLGAKEFSAHDLYYEVAAFLLSFILLGRFLEIVTKKKTSYAIKSLIDSRPKTATIVSPEGHKEVLVQHLKKGDIIIVKPGQKIPADGQVVEGYSTVDESMITGESIEIEKNIGDKVIGGTINRSGRFQFEMTKSQQESALAQIIRLIEEAAGSKAPIQNLADQIAAVFVPVVLAIAVIAFLSWWLISGNFIFALTIFISVLIIACPCSLGLATPTAIMVATGKAAQSGIIIKNAASIQAAQQIQTIIFDKTGTLTEGRPNVTDIIGYGMAEDEILKIAASMEKNSEHILSEAIIKAAGETPLYGIESFWAEPGKGIIGKINGREFFIGNISLMREKNIDTSIASKDTERLQAQGKTTMLVACLDKLIGIIGARDNPKKHARSVIDELKAKGKDVVMITGDNFKTAQAIAQELGIEKVYAGLLPEDKFKEVKRLQEEGKKVAFVGDGINDAPAITRADLGIACGAGVDVAIEAGDFILMKNDLRDVAAAIDLSGYAMNKIKQNLFWAFFYNLVGIPVAAGLLYPFTGFLLNPIVAGIAMAFSSISVVLNSLTIRRYKYPIVNSN